MLACRVQFFFILFFILLVVVTLYENFAGNSVDNSYSYTNRRTITPAIGEGVGNSNYIRAATMVPPTFSEPAARWMRTRTRYPTCLGH